MISHLEFRTEESKDVSEYVFERNLTTIVVPLGEKLQQVKDDYLQVNIFLGVIINFTFIFLDFRLLY